MRQDSRANRAAFHRAVWASVGLHVAAAALLLLFLRTGDERKPLQAGINTRAPDDAQVRMHIVEDAPVSVEVQSSPAQQPSHAEPPETASMQLPDKPFAPSAPQMLPPEMLKIIRKPGPQPASSVVEQPVPPGANHAAITDPNVKPAGAANGNASSGGTSAPALHGALKPEQTVVYVLDCSGSMGASGKFDAARAALVATLKQQPGSVRFQVIVYAGSAVPLVASDTRGLPANEANIRAAAEKLAALDARGKSNHLEAVRAALAFRPDVILILTDADDLNPATIKRLLADAPKPVHVCVGHVTPEGVQRPRELK